MRRMRWLVLIGTAILTFGAVAPVAADHPGPHEQQLPDAACNVGTAAARAGAPGLPFEDPRRRIPHMPILILEGQTEQLTGCFHFNEQFPAVEIIS
jgi:hypothetical protein